MKMVKKEAKHLVFSCQINDQEGCVVDGMMSSGNIHNNVHKFCSSKRRHFSDEGNYGGDYGSLKWMIPSKITKITQEEMTTTTTTSSSNFSEIDHNPMKFTLKFHNQQLQDSEINSSSIIINKNNNNDNNNTRVCSDCNTTTTPLWRSGPRGPKSLCNACGIRQRKARRAMAAAAAGTSGTVTPTEESSSTKFKKKCRTSHVVQCKNMWKPLPDYHLHHRTQKKNCFKKLALHYLGKNSGLERVFPKDVEEAAILLMELSCGFFHT